MTSNHMTLGTRFEKYSKTTGRENVRTEMDRIVPWGELRVDCAGVSEGR